MAREIINHSLKDPSIVAILPAPVITREEAGVCWYDVRADPEAVGCRVDAVDKEGSILESVEAQQVAPNEFKLTAHVKGEASQVITLTAMPASGATRFRARSEDGREVTITEAMVEPRDADSPGADDLGLRGVGDHWQHSVDPIITLAEALKVRAADSRSWGCTSCCVLLGGIAAGTFVAIAEASPGVGVGVVYAGATFIENCEGACA